MNAKLQETMNEYIEATMKSLARHFEQELKLAFLTGVRVGLDEGKRISDNVFEQWEQRDALHNPAH